MSAVVVHAAKNGLQGHTVGEVDGVVGILVDCFVGLLTNAAMEAVGGDLSDARNVDFHRRKSRARRNPREKEETPWNRTVAAKKAIDQ